MLSGCACATGTVGLPCVVPPYLVGAHTLFVSQPNPAAQMPPGPQGVSTSWLADLPSTPFSPDEPDDAAPPPSPPPPEVSTVSS